MTNEAMGTAGVPETGEIQQRGLSILERAKAQAVSDPETFEAAADILRGIKGLRKEIEETFGPPIEQAFRAHKAILAARKKHEAPLEEAERVLKGRIAPYLEAEERKRREEQARLEAEARKAEEEARLREAVAREEAGDQETADALLDAPIVPSPVVAPAIPKAEGISSREIWRAQVFDVVALARAVGEGKAPAGAIEPVMAVLNGLARSLKAEFRLPGCEAIVERTVAARAQ